MRLPKKIDLIYSKRGEVDPRMVGDSWQGYDEKKQIQLLTWKINEILDFLERTVQFPNDTPADAKVEDGHLVHEHDWTVTGRVNGRVFKECLICAEKIMTAT